MRKHLGLLLSALFAAVLSFGVVADAEAKRLGGGKSFGGKSSHSQPYQRNNQQQNSQQQNAQQQASPQQAGASAGGARGGMMGMLGGLALGGLLGALFFGGAFENINFLDILVFALIAFVLYKVFAARRRKTVGDAPVAEYAAPVAGRQERAGFKTDLLFGGKGGAAQSTAGPVSVPADFDSAAFLSGAQAAFRQLQGAWDQGDLADIRGLTTDKVFGELQDQLRERQGENRTEVVKLEAELLEVRERDGELQATVLFDAIMRESAEAQPGQVREVWHFTRTLGSRQPTWYLDGIQQLQD